MELSGYHNNQTPFYRDIDILIPAVFLLAYIGFYFLADLGVFQELKVTSLLLPVIFCVLWMLPRIFGHEGGFILGFILAFMVTAFCVLPLMNWEMTRIHQNRQSMLKSEVITSDSSKSPVNFSY